MYLMLMSKEACLSTFCSKVFCSHDDTIFDDKRLQNVSLIMACTTLEQGDLYLATMLKAEFFSVIFSSPKLKAQLSFSDCLLPVCKKFNIVIIYSITTGPISNKLGSKHPCEKGFKLVQMKRRRNETT